MTKTTRASIDPAAAADAAAGARAASAARAAASEAAAAPPDAPLTREAIAAAALALADECGIENVSARKLAASLGKTAMALYRHFGSIDEIRVAAVALAFEEVDAAPVPGEPWDRTLRRTMGGIRSMYLRHQGAHLHLVEGAGDSPALEAHTRRIYALHEAQGIPPAVLARLWRVVDAFLAGFVMNEAEELARAGRGQVPGTEAWREVVAAAYSDEAFEDGIAVIVAGTRVLAAPDPCDWRTPAS